MNGKPPDPIKEPERFAQWTLDSWEAICKALLQVEAALKALPCDDRQKDISKNQRWILVLAVVLGIVAGSVGIKFGFFPG